MMDFLPYQAQLAPRASTIAAQHGLGLRIAMQSLVIAEEGLALSYDAASSAASVTPPISVASQSALTSAAWNMAKVLRY
jgi:hypothetical protein